MPSRRNEFDVQQPRARVGSDGARDLVKAILGNAQQNVTLGSNGDIKDSGPSSQSERVEAYRNQKPRNSSLGLQTIFERALCSSDGVDRLPRGDSRRRCASLD